MPPLRLTAPSPPGASRLVAALLALAACGCAGQEGQRRDYIPPGRTELLVGELELVGVEQIDETTLREGLATKEDPGWRANRVVQAIPVLGAEHQYYNTVAWEQDKKRIDTFYETRGFFGASIVSERITQTEDGEAVLIRVEIDEGEPTRTREMVFEGISKLEGREDTDLTIEELTRELPLARGEIFTQSSYLEAKATLEQRLRAQSYAYASVQGVVRVQPKEQAADVTFFIDPGPQAIFGEIEVKGLDRVDEEYVRDAISIEPGREYSSDELQETQENIYDLGVFSLVTVQPAFGGGAEEPGPAADGAAPAAAGSDLAAGSGGQALTTGEGAGPGALGISEMVDRAQQRAAERSALPRRVPIVIRVKEAKNWSVRVGGGFTINSTRQDVNTALNLRSRNFLGTLGKLEQFNTVGYALTPGFFQINQQTPGELTLDDFGNRGVYFASQLRYSQPQLFEAKTTGFTTINVERDIQENYIGWVPSTSIGLRRPLFTRKLTAEVSYNVSYIFYQKFDPGYGDELRRQGLDPTAENPSLLLEYLEQKIIYDARDSPLNPTEGFRLQLSLQEAQRYLIGGEFDFIKPRLDVEGYVPWQLGTKWVTALRSSLGTIYNLNDPAEEKGIPLQNRMYGGGKGSIRSFGPRYFGFFTQDLADPGPIGSITLFEASLEQRFRLVRKLLGVGDLWGALYLDAGTFFEDQLALDTQANQAGVVEFGDLPSSLIYGLGTGVYWITPVGPIRGDFAITLTDLSEDPRYSAEIVTDDPTTPFDESRDAERYAQAVQNKVRGFNFYIGIGHSF